MTKSASYEDALFLVMSIYITRKKKHIHKNYQYNIQKVRQSCVCIRKMQDCFLFMASEKIENLLNISMNINEEQRQQSRQLSAGFNSNDRSWEIVIKYSGKEEELEQYFGHPFVFLYNQYAISRGTQEEINHLAANPRVEWIEKPKSMEYAVTDGVRASCITAVSPPQGNLSGKEILIAVIDSGIDVFHPDFRKEDGTTRIVGLWDQFGGGTPPEHYPGGSYYNEETINEALQLGIPEGRKIVPSQDLSGHGTHVAGIAAGNGRASNGQKKGVAPEADLLVVKLGTPTESDFPRTTQVMTGIDFAVRFALERNQPLVINLSFGNNYGAHDGTTILETYMDQIVGLGRITIVAGMGNQGVGDKHTSGNIAKQNESQISFVIGPGEQSLGLQIWKNYADIFQVVLQHPSGERLGPFKYGSGLTDIAYGNTRILFYYGEPVPYSVNQELYVTFLPRQNNLDSGIWQVIFIPERIISGQYEMWLPDAGLISAATKFMTPNPNLTQTIPSTANRIISVGAYDALENRMASFSGRGSATSGQMKPDLVAPGVNIESCAPGGGYTIKTGTSMAAPFVSGSAALMMEWGIIQGNDIYLYGEKVKAYLRKGAKSLPGYIQYPNTITGYGKLCLSDSFPT